MSWGAPPPGQNPYYGQQQGQPGGYQQPPPGGYQQQAPPGGYRGPPPAGYAGAPPQQRPPGGYAPPPQGAPQYGAPAGYGGYGGQAPPPSGYGGAPAGGPPQGYGAPQGGFAPPAPPPGVSPELWQWFQAVDQDRSGKITSVELQRALMNGNWTPFNQETCRLMIGMFDRDRSGTIDVHEFSSLWKYIQDWKGCFDRFDSDRSGSIAAAELMEALKTFGYNLFDRDRSGNIDVNELQNAFRTFGYNLSMQFCQVCVRVFDKQNSNTMNFDNFIQCCVMLKSLTDQFRQKDTQQQGVINIQYEEFLRMVLDNTIR